jgi:hypothetical protein
MVIGMKIFPLEILFRILERGWLEALLSLIHYVMFLIFPSLGKFRPLFVLVIAHPGLSKIFT